MLLIRQGVGVLEFVAVKFRVNYCRFPALRKLPLSQLIHGPTLKHPQHKMWHLLEEMLLIRGERECRRMCGI
jgi:hypothetical protein